MQFTLATLATLALSATAIPTLQARAPIPANTVVVYNYMSPTGDHGCLPADFKGEYASIVDDGTSACRNFITPVGTTSWDLEANVNRPIRFYNRPCGSLGGSQTITLGPGQQPNGCYFFDIAAYQFL